MINELPSQRKGFPYKFYYDNLSFMLSNSYCATGTIRKKSNIPKDCPLAPIEGKPRGRNFESCRLIEDDIMVVSWMDNNIVSMVSSCHGANPVNNGKRYSRVAKRRVTSAEYVYKIEQKYGRNG